MDRSANTVDVKAPCVANTVLADTPRVASREQPRAHWDWGVGLLLALPLLLLLLCDRGWLFGNKVCDAWYYYGYYLDLPQHLRNFSHVPYSSRLSTILVGWFFYAILPPLYANCALHLGLYYVCVFSLYAVLRQVTGRRAALLAAVAMGCHYHFLQEIGWDYVDSFGITYCLLTLLALTTAARSPRWRLALAGAGTAFVALLVAHPTFVLLAPGLLITYWLDNRRQRKNPLLPSVGFMVLGGIGLFVVLATINGLITGNYWFLRSTFAFIHVYGSNPQLSEPYRLHTAQWLPYADHLFFIVVVLLGMIPALWQTWRRATASEWQTRLAFQSQLACTVVLIAICEFWLFPPLTFLRFAIYSSLLIPATFVALGCQLPPLVDPLGPKQFASIMAIFLALVLYVMFPPEFWTKLRLYLPSTRFPALVLAAAALLALWQPDWVREWAQRRPRVLAVVAALLLFAPLPLDFWTWLGRQLPTMAELYKPLFGLGALALLCWPGLVGGWLREHVRLVAAVLLAMLVLPPAVEALNSRWPPPPSAPPLLWALALGISAVALYWVPRPDVVCVSLFVVLLGLSEQQAFPHRQLRNSWPFRGRDNLQIIADATRTVQKVDPRSEIYFWYDAQEPPWTCYYALNCSFNWGYRLINTRFPALTKEDVAPGPSPMLNVFNTCPKQGYKVAILSCYPGAGDRANASLQHAGLQARLLAETPLQRGPIAYTMTFVEIVAK